MPTRGSSSTSTVCDDMTDVRRIVTAGSVWTFRETEHLYLRLPKHERGRARAEWGDGRAGPLRDGLWHPFSYWA
jgi:hypothetical protein